MTAILPEWHVLGQAPSTADGVFQRSRVVVTVPSGSGGSPLQVAAGNPPRNLVNPPHATFSTFPIYTTAPQP